MLTTSERNSLTNADWKTYNGRTPVEMIHGFKLLLIPDCEYSRKRFIYRVAEKNEIDWLIETRKSFFKDSTCLDIGANIGYWTKLLVETLQARQVHSFEPVPETFKVLEKNLSDYDPPRTYLQQSMVGASDDSGYLFIDPNHSGDARPQFTPGRKKIAAKSVRLDDYIRAHNLTSLDFIKIDVQGGEIDVLESAKTTLAELRPLLMIEIEPRINKEISSYVNNIISKHNANAFIIQDNSDRSVSSEFINGYQGNLFIQF